MTYRRVITELIVFFYLFFFVCYMLFLLRSRVLLGVVGLVLDARDCNDGFLVGLVLPVKRSRGVLLAR